MRYTIVWSGRYGDDPGSEPSTYAAVGTLDPPPRFTPPMAVSLEGDILQARFVALRLSDWFPGQDDCYVVEGDDK